MKSFQNDLYCSVYFYFLNVLYTSNNYVYIFNWWTIYLEWRDIIQNSISLETGFIILLSKTHTLKITSISRCTFLKLVSFIDLYYNLWNTDISHINFFNLVRLVEGWQKLHLAQGWPESKNIEIPASYTKLLSHSLVYFLLLTYSLSFYLSLSHSLPFSFCSFIVFLFLAYSLTFSFPFTSFCLSFAFSFSHTVFAYLSLVVFHTVLLIHPVCWGCWICWMHLCRDQSASHIKP